MSGGSSVTVASRQTTIQTQNSTYGLPIPVQFGTNRAAGNLVWFSNFTADAQTTTVGGKGGSGSNTTYNYKAAAILAIAEGTIAGIGQVWKDTELTSLGALGLTLFTGAINQPVWSFLTGYSTPDNWDNDVVYGYSNYGSAPAFVDQAINYSSTAYVASPNYALGDAAQVPNHNFEIQGLNIIGGGNPDANPRDVIQQVLFNQQFGIGFNTSWVDTLTDYNTYCRALGLFVSPNYGQQRPGTDVIKEMAETTNAGPVWSGGKLKIIPYGDTSITGNGVTFTPNLTPLFDLGDDDFIDNGTDSPILVSRTSPADAYNRVAVQFRNRANQYNQEVAYAEDLDAIEKYGLKIAPTITLDFVCVSSIAKQIAQLALQRYLYKRNTYEFELIASYASLEPMDIVTITDLPAGMDRLPVRITSIEEKDHSYLVTAEDLQIGVAAAATYHYDDGVRWTNSRIIAPQSCAAPVIFELPADPSATGLSVALAAGGQPGDLAYGGCNVWISLDGTHYKLEGTIWGSSRYGTLSGTLAAHAAGMDSSSAMHAALRSDGQMLSGSSADVAKGTTLIVCGGEYLAYQTATLTGTRAYDLTTLNRGLYGTTPNAHAAGTPWVRVDNAIARLDDLDLTMIGQTIHIKLTAFNVYGLAEQDLSAVTDYTYTITGDMKALETPVDLAQAIVDQGALATADHVTTTQVANNAGTLQSDATLITGLGTAAAITGQGPLATAPSAAPYANANVPLGQNLIVNSDMVLMDASISSTYPLGFEFAWQGNMSNVGSITWTDARVQLADRTYAMQRTLSGAAPTPANSVFDGTLTGTSGVELARFCIQVQPSDALFASAFLGHQNCSGGRAIVGFLDENGAYVGEISVSYGSTDIGATALSSLRRDQLGRSTGFVTVPADGTFTNGTGRCRWARLWTRFDLNGSPATARGVSSGLMLAKVAPGQTAVPAYTSGPSDRSATYGAMTGSSLRSSTLGVLADGQIITGQGTAAAITGQGDLATANRSSLAFGQNAVVNSAFARGTYAYGNYAIGSHPLDGNTAVSLVSVGINTASGYYGQRNVIGCSVNSGGAAWNAGSNAYIDAFWTKGRWGGGSMVDQRFYGIDVKQNDRVFARSLMARHRCDAKMYALIFDASGGLVEAPEWSGGRSFGAGNGDPANFDVVGDCFTVTHPNAATMSLMWRMFGNGGADPWLFMTEPAMGVIPAGQAVLPPYTMGREDPVADQTATGTAAAIAGQAATATSSDFSVITGSTRPQNNATVGATTGTNLQSGTLGVLSDGQIVTGQGTAAAIAGQGALATKSAVGTSDINSNSVTEVQQAYNGSTISGSYVYITGYDYADNPIYSSPDYYDAITLTVTMAYAGDIVVMVAAKQWYYSGARDWKAQITIDGTEVFYTEGGSGAISDSIALSGKLSVSAGTHTVKFRWRSGDGSLQLQAGKASMVTVRRYV